MNRCYLPITPIDEPDLALDTKDYYTTAVELGRRMIALLKKRFAVPATVLLSLDWEPLDHGRRCRISVSWPDTEKAIAAVESIRRTFPRRW